ncbi:MAG: sugar ABC transporter permease, partial [Thermaerobacter sp.]|nr:sugar ABC transporter permease [Thermaerobacter sp.]
MAARETSRDGVRNVRFLTPRRGGAGIKSQNRASENLAGYLFTTPVILGLAVFTLGPALYAFYLSFYSWTLLNTMHFVGWTNFVQVLTLPLFWIAVRNTLAFALIVVPTQTAIALGLAAILNRQLPARGFFRLAFFFPAIS